MALLFRSLRRFAIFFLVVVAILLTGRMVASALVADANAGYSDTIFEGKIVFRAIDTLLLILSLVGTVVVVVFMYLVVFSAIRWAVLTLLQAPSVAETQPLNRLFGLVAVAVFFGSVITNLYTVLRQQIVGLFSDFPGSLTAAFRDGMGCVEGTLNFRVDVIDTVCVSNIFFDAARTIRIMANQLFGPSGLGQINPVAVLGALAVFLIVSIVSSRVRSDLEDSQRFWLAYACVAFFATYLSLSAILAVPLLSEDGNKAPRPVEQLKTSLEEMVPVALASNTRASDSGKSMSDIFADGSIAAPTLEPDEDPLEIEVWLSDFRFAARSIESRLDAVRGQRAQLRNGAAQTLNNQLNAAVLAYESEVDVRKGQREANRHFVDLRTWFQFVVDDTKAAIDRCETFVEGAEQAYLQSHAFLSDTVSRGHSGTRADARRFLSSLGRLLDEERTSLLDRLREVAGVCDANTGNRYVPPSRSDYGSFLGVVGTAASWLLSTESMEVALLTGLIGFGLLGSLVAQFVKSGGAEEYNTAQIATVVFSGFCAAIVVYVTAYGGLAIASMSGSDPNPYVVFGACLVGAVYSAEIWERAKKWMITGSPDD